MTNHTNPTNITPHTTDELLDMTTDDLLALHADPTNCSCDADNIDGRNCDLHIILNRRLAAPW